jgi:phosphate:Na+ symporter
MGDRVAEMMRRILPALLDGPARELDAIEELDNGVDVLHGEIVTYLGKISQRSLTERHTEEFLQLMGAVNGLENVGDVIETNLVALGRERIESGVTVSPATRAVIESFHAAVAESLDAAVMAVTQKNPVAAQTVIDMKDRIGELDDDAAMHEARRLVAEEPNRLAAYTVEVEILQFLARIYYFTRRMARRSVPSGAGVSP